MESRQNETEPDATHLLLLQLLQSNLERVRLVRHLHHLCLIRLPQAKPELKSTRAQNTGSLVLREIGGSHLLGHGDRSVRLSHNLNTVLDIVVLDLEHESTHSTKDFHWRKE